MKMQVPVWLLVVSLSIVILWLSVLTAFVVRILKIRGGVARAVKQGNLAEAISDSLKDIKKLEAQVNSLGGRQLGTAEDLKGVIQRVGVVRYDAFGDIGGGLSYSVALLNQYGDGVVVTSLNGRRESRSYAKPVEKGKSRYDLSKEEREAIAKALA